MSEKCSRCNSDLTRYPTPDPLEGALCSECFNRMVIDSEIKADDYEKRIVWEGEIKCRPHVVIEEEP